MAKGNEITKEAEEHIREHVQYPATKEQVVEACNEMMCVGDEKAKQRVESLPERKYNSADEVLKALGSA